ncbi:hypothetical protein SLEP1_g998 [Rubroshorea leprosula]|uniref:Uncharacterized protein n=1 Tax=Rubroshorea leprosula TaxID=152421 RepID=A0AAV5HCE8_9ROSI|nr:hypothetical protein SLEP1_g998 [Rubroshorea leprosula]
MELFDPQNLVILAFLHIHRLVSPPAALDVRLLTAESRSAISAFGRCKRPCWRILFFDYRLMD